MRLSLICLVAPSMGFVNTVSPDSLPPPAPLQGAALRNREVGWRATGRAGCCCTACTRAAVAGFRVYGRGSSHK